MKTIFLQIPRILFEPLAIFALFGIATALYLGWKKRDALWNFISLALLFMILWRSAISLISSRYASVLLYPTILFAVYFLYRLPALSNRISSFPQRFRPHIPLCLLVILIIACLGKSLHYNPYRYVLSCSALVAADAVNYSRPWLLTEKSGRISQYEYYARIPGIERDLRKDGRIDYSKIIAVLEEYKLQKDVIYLCLNEPADAPAISAEELHLPKKNWQFLGAEYHNRRRKKVTRVYRYLPGLFSRKIQKINEMSAATSYPAESLLENGDFKTFYPEHASIYPFTQKMFVERGIAVPDVLKEKNLPQLWKIRAGIGFVKGTSCNIRYDEHALLMETNNLISIWHDRKFPAARYLLQFCFSAEKGTRYDIVLYLYHADGKWGTHRFLGCLPVEETGKYVKTIAIDPAMIAPYQSFCIALVLHRGKIRWHYVALLDRICTNAEKISIGKEQTRLFSGSQEGRRTER